MNNIFKINIFSIYTFLFFTINHNPLIDKTLTKIQKIGVPFQLFIFGLFCISVAPVQGQILNTRIIYDGFFDNREYFHEFSPHYTIFGNRLTTGLSINFNDSIHLHGGVSLLKKFGDRKNNFIDTYYSYFKGTGDLLDVYVGIFPRKDFTNLNQALLNDTLQYFRPFIQGIGACLKLKQGYLDGWLDWTGKQTYTIRESFLLGIKGKWYINHLYIQHEFLAHHFALPKNPHPDDHIRDNIGAFIAFGVEYERLFFLDYFMVNAGTLVSFDRVRSVYDWQVPTGFIARIYLKYKLLSINASLYQGQSHDLMFGDPFYLANTYARINCNLHLFETNFLTGLVQLSFHSIEGEINYSQLLRITMDIDRPIYNFKN